MGDSTQAAVIAALKSTQEQFGTAGQQYGRLYHAILEGAAIHDQQCVREYLKAVIADGTPFQQHHSTINTPCSFYFGDDLNAAELFDQIASQVYELLDDGTGEPEHGVAGNPLYGLPDLPGWLLDHGKGGALLWWVYWLGDKYNIPTIKAQRGQLSKDDGAILGTALDGKRLGRPVIRMPNGQSCHGDQWPVLPEKPWESVDYPDDFSYLWRAVHFGEVGEIYIYRRSVFLCAQLGIGVLIDHIERRAAAVGTGQVDVTATEGRAGPGNRCLYRFEKKGKVWDLRFEEERGTAINSVGLEHIAALLRFPNPTRRISALDLKGVDAQTIDGSSDQAPILDEEAKRSYRKRLQELVADIAEAKKAGNVAEQEQLQQQKEAIEAELIKASVPQGKGNRSADRAMGGRTANVKAANAVAQAIDRAFTALEESSMPRLARHLRESIGAPKSYTFAYCPRQNPPPDWQF